ncbi:hypothetical protein BASA81_012172 [Batrachochytrium salamandrivorans]|nr:hypothetical protein BASA81_012172 [Batrachochytrium salamandrivorans]
MKFHAFSLIAMFMVTANALIIPMDSMGDASGLVKRQEPNPTEDPTLKPTDDPTPPPPPPPPPPVLTPNSTPMPTPRSRPTRLPKLGMFT